MMDTRATQIAVAIMQGYIDGEQLQVRMKCNTNWVDVADVADCQPRWDWDRYDYRIKPIEETSEKYRLSFLDAFTPEQRQEIQTMINDTITLRLAARIPR